MAADIPEGASGKDGLTQGDCSETLMTAHQETSAPVLWKGPEPNLWLAYLLRSTALGPSCDPAPSSAADPSQPEQAEQAAAKPQSGLSEAEKAERRKAKKARQRADRAQAAAQSAEVRQPMCTPAQNFIFEFQCP